jgi:hypothetical protein
MMSPRDRIDFVKRLVSALRDDELRVVLRHLMKTFDEA